MPNPASIPSNPENLEKALAQLRDIHLPKPLGFWPIAPGWYVLLIIFLLAAYGFYRWFQRQKIKRHALVLLKKYEQAYQKAEGALASTETVLNVSDLLRRVALVYYPRAEVAGLNGLEWLNFLTKSSKGVNFTEIAPFFIHLPYQKVGEKVDLRPVFVKSRAWIKQRGGHV